jgi:subfamily B ATP-binding cassette protein HlyB/CyaB
VRRDFRNSQRAGGWREFPCNAERRIRLLSSTLTAEDFVWLVGSLCQLSRVPFDAALLTQRFPAPHDRRQLLEACRALDFRVGESAIGRAAFPCVAFLKGGASRPALLLKADRERLLYFAAGSEAASTLPLAQFAERFERDVLLVRHEESPESTSTGAFGWRWFGDELARHKRVWRDVLAASLCIQLIGLAMPLGTQVVIDKVVVHHTTSTLAVIAAGLGLFLAFNAAMSWLRQYLVLHTGNRVDAVLGSQVLRHLLRLHLPYFSYRPTGTLVARLHAVESIREFLAGAAVSLILDAPFLVVFLAVMFFYSWQLTLIALALLVLIVFISVLVTPALRLRLNRQFLLGARNQAFLTEYVAGIETVKSLQMEPRLESRYDEYLAHYLAASFSTRQLSNGYQVAVNALEQAMTLGILCVGALLVMRNDGFTIGMLVAFQMFASRMSQPMLRLASLWQEFQQASIAVKRLGDIMDAPAEPHALVPSRAPEGRAEIRVAGLSFRYSAEFPWLYRNLGLALQPGRLTVLTGPSGSGKSTLAKLLLGFYAPEEGSIAIDGRDVRHFSANELRQYFGVVPQETVLFAGTLYENLIAANPNAGFADVVEACRIAEVHDVIERLPKGYNTEIGEHGVGLSGGQKQRIAIARAVLKRPRVLIFDEATASLDSATAEKLADTVNRLKGAATILFIAHQVPKGLAVDEFISLSTEKAVQMRVYDHER